MLTEPLTLLVAGKLPTLTVPCTGSGVLMTLTSRPDGGPPPAARLAGTLRPTASTATRSHGRKIRRVAFMEFPLAEHGMTAWARHGDYYRKVVKRQAAIEARGPAILTGQRATGPLTLSEDTAMANSDLFVGAGKFTGGTISGLFRQKAGEERWETITKGLPEPASIQALTVLPGN